METQLRQVNAQFARLNGMSGANVLDLYGRTAAQQLAPAVAAPELRRAASKRLPLRETTRALLRQAHSKLPQSSLGSPAGGDGAGFESLPGSVAGSLPVSRMPSTTAGQGPGLSGANLGLSMGGAMSRQATVRFDVPSGGSGEAGVVPRISSARFASERGAGGGPRVVPRVASAGAVGAGVLQIPDEREERLQPYRWGLGSRLQGGGLLGLSLALGYIPRKARNHSLRLGASRLPAPLLTLPQAAHDPNRI